MRGVAALCALLLGLSACSSDSPAVRPTIASQSPSPSASSPTPAASASPSTPTTTPPAATLANLSIRLRTVARGLDTPVGASNAGDETIYVIEQAGRIMRIEPGASPQAYLDIRGRVGSGGERGLLGLAFHPGFESNGRLFVNYTNTRGDTRISEFSGTATSANAGSEKQLLAIDQPFANHNGGAIAFDRTGMLLIATGDGGSGGDPQNNGQDLSTLLGKILRIDVDAGSPYGIPADNPFRGRSGARPEILDYGLRNPWRISVDRQTGDLWIGDVGQGALEEIDLHAAPLSAAKNFGWRIMEGRSCYNASSCNRGGLTGPVAQYDHSQGDRSVTGGSVYRGSASPKLRGFYFYGDAYSGFIRALSAADARDGTADSRIVSRTNRSIVSFGETHTGEILVVAHDGTIMQITS